MDKNVAGVDDDIVIIVENEAESLPAEEEKRTKQQGSIGLMDTCSVCKLSFHNREPKLLPCLHSFCKRCLPTSASTADPRRESLEQLDSNKACEDIYIYIYLCQCCVCIVSVKAILIFTVSFIKPKSCGEWTPE